VTPEQLETRWVTPLGRDILARVVADLHEEGGLNLPAILSELEGSDEIEDGLDLRYAPLEGEHLDEVNLYAVSLTGAFLSGSRMQKVDLRDATLDGVIFEGADLRGAYLSNCDLGGALLKGANLSGAMLDSTNLAGANLVGSTCIETYFSGSNLDGADLRGANLNQADFSETATQGTAFNAGALDRAAAPPPDISSCVIDPGQARGRQTGRRRPPGNSGGGGRRRPDRARATMPLRQPGRSGAPNAVSQRGGRPPNGAGPLRDWDLALAKLFPLRGQVSRITIIVDGREQVLFEG
jgi:hypothetical protein